MYAAYIPDLAKLLVLSSAIHQLVFSYKSTLPFAIAQGKRACNKTKSKRTHHTQPTVQDAGLIFLSSMATTIALNTASPKQAVSTSVVLLSLATLSLGAVVNLVGRFKLASVVSLIPTTVVAGYLAFIGLFCVLAGIGLSAHRDVAYYTDVYYNVDYQTDLYLILPAVLSGILLTYVSRNAESWKTLPITIVCLPLSFYAFCYVSGTSLAAARLEKWINPISLSDSVFEILALFDFNLVKWSLIPKLLFEWLGMTALVVFASALDIVAVEMDLNGKELDIDRELTTVGVSNMISGAFGGYTGSYIFSQTIFTRRTGVGTKYVGLILSFVEFVLFLAPFSLMSYVPRFFFAATLIYIGLDLMIEWLFLMSFRISHRELMLVLITFFAITFMNDLIMGIAIGVIASVINFISHYASIDQIKVAPKSSNVLRDYEGRKMLVAFSNERIIALRLSGYLFFGTSTSLLKQIKEFLKQGGDGSDDDQKQQEQFSLDDGERRVENYLNLFKVFTTKSSSSSSEKKALLNNNNNNSVGKAKEKNDNTILFAAKNYGATINFATNEAGSPTKLPLEVQKEKMSAKAKNSRRYLILDFDNVIGIDATTISTGFMRIKMLTKANNLKIIFTSLSPAYVELMKRNEILGNESDIIVRLNLNDGLDYCETDLLKDLKKDLIHENFFGGGVYHITSSNQLGVVREEEASNVNNNSNAVTPALKRFRYHTEPEVPQLIFSGSENDPDYKKEEKRVRASFGLLIESFFGWGG